MIEKTESKYSQLCDELKEIAGELKCYYIVNNVKPYAVYVYATASQKSNWPWGDDLFDILPEKIIYHDEEHKILDEAFPIVQKIQAKLCEIRDHMRGRVESGELREFKSENGHVYLFPKKHCVFCKHCTDLFYEYSNGPYMFFCDLDTEVDDHHYESCGMFEEE